MYKALVLDIDGTLTDGKIYVGVNGEIMKVFNVKDGLGIKKALTNGLIPIVITGRNSIIVKKRCEELGISHIYQGVDDKASFLLRLFDELRIHPKETICIGDDENDIEMMMLCGFTACPADAIQKIKKLCSYISIKNGGDGAVRDIIEYILN